MIYVSYASIDENGKVSGGKAGNQTGKELRTNRELYDFGQDKILRLPTGKAKKLATFMLNATKNQNIGYNQADRNSLTTELKKVNYVVGKVTTKCNTDCSALVGSGLKKLNKEYQVVGTGQMVYQFVKNFPKGKVLPYDKDNLKLGDILLKAGKHVVVVTKITD